MRAVLLTGHGGPERLEYHDDVADPEPASDEVLVVVGASGVNNTDIWTREGAYGSSEDPNATSGWRRDQPMRFPRIQGADVAGRSRPRDEMITPEGDLAGTAGVVKTPKKGRVLAVGAGVDELKRAESR